jgi:mRNA-degrading endonuclease YafQ of YafQ-DinJ toxin-antitoxin module
METAEKKEAARPKPVGIVRDSLSDLDSVIEKLFYQNLVAGKVDAAKKTLAYIKNRSDALKSNWFYLRADFEKIDSEKSEIFTSLMLNIDNKLRELQNIAKSALGELNNEEFAKDPETWKGVLISEFKQLVEDIVSLLGAAKTQFGELEELKNNPQKNLIALEYLDRYNAEKKKLDASAQKLVSDAEYKIQSALAAGKYNARKITDKILSGDWKGHWHAWLPKPLGAWRIVYLWDAAKRKIIFETVDTKTNLGIN